MRLRVSRLGLRSGPVYANFRFMKTLAMMSLVFSLAVSAFAIEKAELDKRIHKLTSKFESLQSKPDKRIPADTLKKSKGIVFIDRTKAGFIFAYEGGGGLAMMKDKSGKWSAPIFLKTGEASLGFQIGGQQSFVVLVLMHTNAIRMLTDSEFKFGGEASGTAGNASGKAEGVVSDQETLYVTYTDAEGLYGGAALKGGALTTDSDASLAYYGQFLTTKEILLDKKVKPSEPAQALIKRIEEYSKK